ncbi:MAG: hypothetical protein IJ071_04900 [Ruminococcus sp.]|nr:hypothetical protein [Ruminococcus sp.]
MEKRATLKMLSIVSLVLAPVIGGWGIYRLTQLGVIYDDLEISTGLLSFGILGAFELFRAGMTNIMYAGALLIGTLCLFNALCMAAFGILSLIAVKKRSVKLVTGLLWAARILMILVFAVLLVQNIPVIGSSFIGFAGYFIGCGLMTLSLLIFSKVLEEERDVMLAPPAEELPEEAPEEEL